LLVNMFLFAATPILLVVQDVYHRDCSPEVDDVEGLAAASTKHLELLKQKDKAEKMFSIEKIVGKLLSRSLDLFQWMRVLLTL
jgi:hypothetical protein